MVALTEHYLKPMLELIGAAIVVIGVLLAVFRYALFVVGSKKYPGLERIQLDLVHLPDVRPNNPSRSGRTRYGGGPTVADLGALAGIVLIRATLSYFLSKDLERGVEETEEKRRKDETEL